MAKEPVKKAAVKKAAVKKPPVKKTAATKKAAVKKPPVKKTAATKKAAVKKAPVKKAAAAKKTAVKKQASRKTAGKNVRGYGAGSVDVVMSVDQVAREAASIAANAPTRKGLEKLASGDVFLTINDLRASCSD